MFGHFVGLVLKWLNLNLVKLKAANSRSDSFDQIFLSHWLEPRINSNFFQVVNSGSKVSICKLIFEEIS